MLLIIVISFSVLLLTTFIVKPKKLHLFEILGIWFTVTAVNSPLYTYFTVNRHWITVPDSMESAVIRIIFTILLTPLIITWALDEVLKVKQLKIRLVWYGVTIGILCVKGLLLHVLGGVHIDNGALIWYPLLKAFVLLIALASVRLIRLLLKSDGIRI